MAGSYNHVIDDNGDLIDPMMMLDMLENGGDVFEAVEEMYGMIWWLAHMAPDAAATSPAGLVEMSRQQYASGVALAKHDSNKRKHP